MRGSCVNHENNEKSFETFCWNMWREVITWGISNVREVKINPLTPELNPSAQRCLTRYFTGDFASWTVHFVNIYVKNQQMQQIFIQFINYVR
jgi:hypothetical protein